MPPWVASFDALDLSFEMGTLCLTSGMHIECTRRQHKHKVSFAEDVDLFVGSASELFMSKWPHRLTVSHHHAQVFEDRLHDRTEKDTDLTSFLAAHCSWTCPPAVPIMEDERIFHGDEAHDEPADPDEPDLHDEGSEEEFLSSPEPQAFARRPPRDDYDWRTVMIFALNREAVPLRLDWSDWEGVNCSIARELGLYPGQLFHVHRVSWAPLDLHRAHVEAVIAHRHDDIPVGAIQILVLVDVEFHSMIIMAPPEVVRKVYKIMDPIGRDQLLLMLGLGPYCDRHRRPCLM